MKVIPDGRWMMNKEEIKEQPDKQFAQLFKQYMDGMRNEMRDTYHRVLPSGELIFNRFEKSKYLGCGEGTSIYDTSVVMGDVKIGDHVWVGPYTLLEGSNAQLTIGDYVSIDAGVMIYTHDSTKYYVSGGKCPFESGDVSIGDYTVIGTMSMIGYGVRIGSHCVVAANSFVNEDIPDYSIAAGNPAVVIGKVVLDDEEGVRFEYFKGNEEHK